jgi:hypothetical protein
MPDQPQRTYYSRALGRRVPLEPLSLRFKLVALAVVVSVFVAFWQLGEMKHGNRPAELRCADDGPVCTVVAERDCRGDNYSGWTCSRWRER